MELKLNEYPIKFIIPNDNYEIVRIYSNNFPINIDKELDYCEYGQYFSKIIYLPTGLYTYQFEVDGKIAPDLLRAPNGGEATIELGVEYNDGIIFDLSKSFIKNNHLVLILAYDISVWTTAVLNIQTLNGIEIIKGKDIFFEGSYEYQMFTVPISQEEVLAYFEIQRYNETFYLGENGLKEKEWAICPIEISQKTSTKVIQNSDIIAIYSITNQKAINEFEKHNSYFDKIPIDYIIADLKSDSILLDKFIQYPKIKENKSLTFLLRDIFLEKDDINPSLGLLGRFAYETKQDLGSIPFSLSDDNISFWNLIHRDFTIAKRAIGFQLLCSMIPNILFGEEIGLVKNDRDRQMFWSRSKWNKELLHYYQRLLKLRKKYIVLRQGRFRFVLQDCQIWGIERYMQGEESIFIFANHSKNNVIVDLTEIMGYSGPILELLNDYPIKRKKVCTIFAETLVVFRSNNISQKKSS